MPSTTDRLSTGTVIFPISKHIDYCLSQSDRTSRSDGIREKAKNKVYQSSCAKCHQSILNWAPSSSRGRITSISASPIPIEPAVRTLFAKGLKVRIVPIAISMCQVPLSVLKRHRRLPEVETHRLVPLPFRSDQPFGRYSWKGKKLGLCQSPSACAKCQRPILKRHLHLPEVHTLISASPIPIGPAVRTLFAKRLKIRSVPIGMCQVPQIDSR